MSTLVPIGEFSLMTNLSRKALRIYHELGLLEPAEVDQHNGYRYYATDQIGTAQLIRRFRDLGMGIPEVKAVLAAPDEDSRNALLTAHLHRMEAHLRQTADTVAALRDLLSPHPAAVDVSFQTFDALPAWSISSAVGSDDLGAWFADSLDRLITAARRKAIPVTGPLGGVFERELVSDEFGRMTLFVPTPAVDPPPGVAAVTIPGGDYAVLTHHGSHHEADRAYGELGRYVSEQVIGAPGLIRERYLPIDPAADALDVRFGAPESRTEICWPVVSRA
ncbi:MerR family transcriptional regulator [Microlunatus endophyticus]|uniref:MerR family transcriptional regulator n=1 Tax=Microlunatus endophyticus TaxID=1716077 RepID=A0A917RZF7_9ACTN|nr:MerR family transcriptional regulator [Microlunatus endophyticus]GGL46915.1 MerR family transcriptional regulator [Microlunatus endophyticus]